VVTPFVNNVAQTPVRFNSAATTETVTGLTNGTHLQVRGQGHQLAGGASSGDQSMRCASTTEFGTEVRWDG
jgi:hypothetical protein